MAADHQRKRPHGASVAGYGSWEQYRTKKKRLESAKNDVNATSHISLEWDGRKKKVVAKREQIGISQRHLRPFVDSIPQRHNILADVFSTPPEIFQLKDLREVLSYEVWQTHLSDNERNFLTQFLPRGLDAGEVVQTLLHWDNFHFGNPFLKWGASLCSGFHHPDAVCYQEQCLKADKKAYYSDIEKYHNDMIYYLQKLKEAWESSKDPEKEILQKTWRSRRDAEKKIVSCANDSTFHKLEENVLATSESCSLVAEDKSYSSDNQTSAVAKGGERQMRIHERGSSKEKFRKSMVASDDPRQRNGDKIQKRNIHHSDCAKYMSYLKISKKQYELVKSMKQSGKSIQSKSLNRVLGDLDTLHVQPFEEFVKEEQNKLRDHWLQLAKKDLSLAYANWRKRQFQRREMIESLEQEMKCKLQSVMEDEEKENYDTELQDQNDQGVREHKSDAKDEEKEDYVKAFQDEEKEDYEKAFQDEEKENYEKAFQVEEKENFETMLQDQNDEGTRNHESNLEDDGVSDNDQEATKQESSEVDDGDSGSGSPEYHLPQKNSSLSVHHDIKPMDVDSEINHVASRSGGASPDESEHSGDLKTADASNCQGVPISSGEDVWSGVSIPNSYYESTVNHVYTSAGGLSLPHQVNVDQEAQLIDLESEVHEEDTRKDLLHSQSDIGSFSSYPNHDQNGLLQSLFKGQDMLFYHPMQKQTGLDLQSPNNLLMGNSQFPVHLQGQLQPSLPLDQEHKRHNGDYMQQSMSENVYSDGGGYVVPRQAHVPPINLQDWAVNSVSMSGQFQSPLNADGLLTQSWFSGEHRVCGGWSSSADASVASQSIGSNTDQSLYSVLSQCNQLHPGSSFNSMGSSEQFALPRSYAMVGVGTPRIGNSSPQPANLDYLSGCDTTSSLIPDDMGWMNLPQNSALHDPMGKPYLKSWNQ